MVGQHRESHLPVSDTSSTGQLERIALAAVRLGALGPTLARLGESMAAQAREQAERARVVAENMQQLTAQLEDATGRLRGSSRDVARALSTVTRIAAHTRILAINASIEASRAGVHGRAFGVVVEEVQRLADDTAATTEEIGTRITEMNASIACVAEMTGDSEARVVSMIDRRALGSSVSRANDEIRGIAEGTERQLTSVDHLSAMGEDVKSMTDALLVAIGTFRFAAHARAEEHVAGLLAELGTGARERRHLEKLMERWIEHHPHFELVYFTDAGGQQIVDNIACANGRASRDPSGFRRDWSDRPWFRTSIANPGISSTNIYRSRATGDFCFTVAGALRDARGHLRGVLAGDVNFQQLLSQ